MNKRLLFSQHPEPARVRLEHLTGASAALMFLYSMIENQDERIADLERKVEMLHEPAID
jgi:hypothetical protein